MKMSSLPRSVLPAFTLALALPAFLGLQGSPLSRSRLNPGTECNGSLSARHKTQSLTGAGNGLPIDSVRRDEQQYSDDGRRVASYSWVTRQASKADFVEIASVIPDADIDLRYATNDNVFNRRFYRTNRAFARRGTVERLRKAQAILARSGVRLRVWDAYRPRSVQMAMWESVRDARYVGPPGRGSQHSRGAAVDVTLVDRRGRELDMPTGFDDFSPRAHVNARTDDAAQAKHRALLQDAMRRAGFRQLRTEWWHFYDPEAYRYGLSDIPIHQLAQMADAKRKPTQARRRG